MKIISYMALLYGRPYISWAIKSVIDFVDEFHILYATAPSHGSPTHLKCPDTEDELRALAEQAAGRKLFWHTGNWLQENQQRNAIHEYSPDADVILIVDSDEVYRAETLKFIESEMNYKGLYITIPFYHWYRDFYHAVMHDPAAPARVIFPKAVQRDWVMSTPQEQAICHFGYAQPADYIRYKLDIHGHKGQLRCSADEYISQFYMNTTRWTDLHPVGSQWWFAEEVNPLDYMPEWMVNHPYFKIKVMP